MTIEPTQGTVPPIASGASTLEPKERARLETYLRGRFGAPGLVVKPKGKSKDSAEVYIGDEFVGTLSRDDEDGDLSYYFTMSILELDLEG